jgi:sirohydrochlorin cobaltochelatase
MTDLVIHRVLNLLRAQAGEAPPPLTSTALFLAGHGTPRNRQSRVAIERQVDVLAQRRIFGEVHPAFMLEPPFIADCWQDTQCADLVMVPYFIADGMHTQEDIPILLGEPQSHLRTRLAAGAPGYPNPLRRGSQRLWLTPALGTDPSLVNVVLEQVAEAQAEALALPPPGATG